MIRARERNVRSDCAADPDRESVTIVEVGPRDGFQSVAKFIPTAQKIAVIDRLLAAGVTRLEAGSFVSPSALPQMADIHSILDALRTRGSVAHSVLVPNAKGARLAVEAGIGNLVFVLSASEAHNRRNVRRSVDESLDELRIVIEEIRPKGRFRFNLSTAFDCPYDGRIPLVHVMRIVERVLDWIPESEICLCDTTGRALPRDVAAAFAACRASFGPRAWAYHAHDTYGLGLATIWAAFQQGVDIFDASVAGLGGCPFAPGATGNVATEDVVYMFESSNITTDIDLEAFMKVANMAEQLETAVVGGRVRSAVSATAARRPQ
jgi:hydroxymethylglutaryl-CoA lyase